MGEASLPRVYLVGAGPGDPELMTVKARRLLGEADHVVYDRLVAPGVLELIPFGAERHYAGKATNIHPVPQSDINALLVRLARAGGTVVRLKGGDPFIFGRGCEEALYLAAHGIPFEVVPGVTAASACAARLGIPLTHRELASGVRFVTGHRCSNAALDLNWRSLADPDTTLVVYMGLANLACLTDELVRAGLPAATPAAAVASATTANERVCCAPLSELAGRVAAGGLRAPVLLVIGRVVALAQAWDAADSVLPAFAESVRREHADHA